MIPCALRKIDSEGRACEGPSWQHQQGSYPPSPSQQHQQDSYLPSHCSTLSLVVPLSLSPFHSLSLFHSLSSSSTALSQGFAAARRSTLSPVPVLPFHKASQLLIVPVKDMSVSFPLLGQTEKERKQLLSQLQFIEKS